MVGDKDPEDITRYVDELATNRCFVALDLFAHHHKASFGLPVPKFEAEFTDGVDRINSLPLSDLMQPTLEVGGQSGHDDVRQRPLFEKTKKVVSVKARIGSKPTHWPTAT